jgi:hypothetical protein
MFEASPRQKKNKTLSQTKKQKHPKPKRGSRVAQVVAYLPSK